jgi:prolyl-tRNA synthetase
MAGGKASMAKSAKGDIGNKIEAPKELTAKKADFSRWYSQILLLAEIVDKRYDVKGAPVWFPYGFGIMQNVKKYWDKIFTESGIKEMYFPLLVPVKYCKQNPGWWEGFKSQAYWVKSIDDEKAEHILRPTGEPAMYPMFSLWIRSHRDLPFRIYETVNSYRYETRHTRPLIRAREMTTWHEIHTAHATKEDSIKEEKEHMRLYDLTWEYCAIEPLRVIKPEWETFPGSVGAIEYYNYMPSGKVLENGSINNLGQAYAKKFNIKFKDKDEKEKYVWQLCTGNGARMLSAVIGIHGDDKGLVIPPSIADTQVIVVPIYDTKSKAAVIKKAKAVLESLLSAGIRADIDVSEDAPGSKFYNWEIKGVPIRLEIGPRDIKSRSVVLARRDTGEKTNCKETVMIRKIKTILEEIQKRLLEKSKKQLKGAIYYAQNEQEIKSAAMNKKIVKIHWCGSGDCWDKIKGIEEGIELFGTDLKKSKPGKCAVCGKKTTTVGYVAFTY